MKFLRLSALFIFLFMVATVSWAGNLVMEEPKKCLSTLNKCAVFNMGKLSFDFELGPSRIVLGKDGIIIRKSSNHIQIIQGQILINTKSTMIVESVYGEFTLEQGRSLFTISDEEIVITNLSGTILATYEIERHKSYLPPGFQNWYGGLNKKGKRLVGIPRPASHNKTIRHWSQLEGVSKRKFKKLLDEFKPHWHAALNHSGPWSYNLLQRRIAEIEEEKRLYALWLRKQNVESRKLRAIFRKKTYHD